jgi:hypothetical protein
MTIKAMRKATARNFSPMAKKMTAMIANVGIDQRAYWRFTGRA